MHMYCNVLCRPQGALLSNLLFLWFRFATPQAMIYHPCRGLFRDSCAVHKRNGILGSKGDIEIMLLNPVGTTYPEHNAISIFVLTYLKCCPYRTHAEIY